MRVTPLNVARFWIELMFPPVTPHYYRNRLRLRGDLPWEPWLHCAVWLAVITVLITGEREMIPPFEDIDGMWVLFGLVSPVIGFSSVWMMKFKTGRQRYVALWLRMIADMGLSMCIGIYLVDLWVSHEDAADRPIAVVATVVLFFSMWFTLVLVVRDIRFIVMAEKLAVSIYRDLKWSSVNCQSGVADVLPGGEDAGK